ncbi:hypothetical protein [Gardnerella vaginalis]|uniref:ApeA N-terminal domain 1-containing protein n=1 Tax=Gardnerella vaginalis TaxID=2702 RepID=UPI000C7E65C5|nr:hypothetical protein [Gardnerella vaginalis]NSX29527.1 hypothetical protein [Gardnerella vaginalis]PKZ47029.1 hypothetical protein CYJ67_04250 [Gardnerella vaginalis]
MEDKSLDLTKPVLGFLKTDNNDSSEIVVMLHDNGMKFELSVLFKELSGQIFRWFLGNSVIYVNSDAKYETINRLPVPNILQVLSPSKTYTLVGCRYVKSSTNVMRQIGIGTITCNYIIVGSNEKLFEKITNLRTSCSNLYDWFISGGISVSNLSDDGESIKINIKKSSSKELCKINPMQNESNKSFISLSLAVNQHVRKLSKNSSIVSFEEEAFIETHSEAELNWEKHISIHNWILNLISISKVERCEFSKMEVGVEDNNTCNDSTVRWFHVLHHLNADAKDIYKQHNKQFLFDFDDINICGIEKWFELLQRYGRAMGIISHLAKEQNNLPVESVNISLGVALEDIGLGIIKSKGQRHRMNKNGGLACFMCALCAIKDEFGEYFPVDIKDFDWLKEMNDIYKKNKHADANENMEKTPKDYEKMYRINVCFINIIRLWIGKQLGVELPTMLERLNSNIFKYNETSI